MEFIDLVNQQCPSGIQQNLSQTATALSPVEETRLFSMITSIDLDTNCAYAVIGYLSRLLSPGRSVNFKINYLAVATKYGAILTKDASAVENATIRQELKQAIMRIINDIQDPTLQGMILAVLLEYQIDLISEIAARVDYRSLAVNTYHGNWRFNEYAACMREAGAEKRVEKIFAQSDAQDLRVIFTEVRSKYVRGNYCFPSSVMKKLVHPYLQDNRLTANVEGDGPPVSQYARLLMDVL